MEALVHLDPERCVCVLGPQVSAQYLVATGLDPTAIPAVMSHRGLVEAGIRKLVEVESFESTEAKQRKETLLRSAYELDPTFPPFKVTEKLREVGEYEQWLAEAFAPVSRRPAMLGFNATLEHLTSLQRQGMLLAYSHYDPVLLNSKRFKAVLMDDEEGVREWVTSASGGAASLLCVHGSLDVPYSLRWDSVAYSREVGESHGGKVLKEVCKTRCVVFFGFDADFYDPLIQKFCTTFLPTPAETPALLISTQPGRQLLMPSVLTVRVSQLALEKVLLPVPTSQQGNSAQLYRSQDKQKCIHVTLLYSDNSSGLNSADKIKSMSSVGATQITLTQDSKYHQLSLHVDSGGMDNLWKVVCGSTGSSAIHMGLLAVRLEGGVTMWLSGGGGSPQSCKGESIHSHQPGLKPEKNAPPPAIPTLPLHSSPHCSSSTVSVISSHWASPIPSPSVTKFGLTPSPSTRPTLPSPLMNSTTKRSPQKGTLSNFEFICNMPISVCSTSPYAPQMHQHMRRIQSEHDRLSYSDRISEEEKRKRNGMLIHQESAPAIIVNDATQTLSVPSASTLAKLQSNLNEHRIECIDQLTVHATSGTSAADTKTKGEQPNFLKLRQQFINDGMEWSKKLSISAQQQQQQQKKMKTEEPSSISASTVGMSMEDQEKLLSQHFEKSKQRQTSLHLLGQHSPSFTLSSLPTPPTVPFGTHSVSSPQGSPLSSRPRSKSPKPSPIHLPSSTATLVNPMMSASGLYGFVPTTSALQGLQSPAANLLFNPSSHAQYAAILNQYLQMMSPQNIAALAASNKQQQQQQQPLIISDPVLLQSLQQAVVLLPDGTIAPANLDSVLKDSTQQQASPTKTPSSAGKRAQSPSNESSKLAPPPKRRRSSSLPDITQLPSVIDKNTPIQEDQEAEEREAEESAHDKKEGTKKRNMPPLSMIQIPKEVKMHDPMIGFPTPPQSSPHFASSPLIPNVVSTMFQPHPMTPITPGQDTFNHEDLKELVGETNVQTPVPASPNGAAGLPPFPTGRGPIQLWQFLLDLLISPDKKHLIHWTGNGYEFRILLPEEIAKLWGARKNKPRMNYDKLSRGLRYYYSKGIMDKVPGKKLTFKYTCDVPNYLQSRGSAAVRTVHTNGKAAISTEA